MLRYIRVFLAVAAISVITFYFVDFAGILPGYFAWLEKIQFMPALFSHSMVILGGILLLTLLFGRVYCSVICPLGILQDACAWISKKTGKKKAYKYGKPKTVTRYVFLGLGVVALVTGFSLMLSLLDPYAAYGRIASNLFYPLYVLGNNLLELIFSSAGSYAFYKMDPSVLDIASFAVALATLGVVVVLSWFRGRLYCNSVCPVGTLLGLVGKYSLFKIRIDVAKCTSCGACARKCKSSCIDAKDKSVDNSRCVACYNCLGTCRFGALGYSPSKPKPDRLKEGYKGGEDILWENKSPSRECGNGHDESRRTFIAASLAAVFVLPKVIAQHKITVIEGGVSYERETPICPPGSGSRAHLARHCTACHLCISKCPSRVLKPAFMEYGLAGMMQPVMFFEKGFCNFDCTVCGDVCPNKAISPLTVEEKHMTQVGRVVFLKDNCIVYRDNTSCGACSEHCPTQAVTMVPYKDGLTIPHTDPDICVGCGGCEYVCPVRPFRAIYVNGNEVHRQREHFEDEKLDVVIDDFGF